MIDNTTQYETLEFSDVKETAQEIMDEYSKAFEELAK
jgi:ribosomal protein S17E